MNDDQVLQNAVLPESLPETQPPPAPKKRGFAALSPERVREIASKGGKGAHAKGTAHKFAAGSEEAKDAGRKGGIALRVKRTRSDVPKV